MNNGIHLSLRGENDIFPKRPIGEGENKSFLPPENSCEFILQARILLLPCYWLNEARSQKIRLAIDNEINMIFWQYN